MIYLTKHFVEYMYWK